MKKLTLRAVVSEGAGMRYNKTIMLSNGVECCLRNGTEVMVSLYWIISI